MSENTISNTRLLSLIVAMSVVALSIVLSGGDTIGTEPLTESNKPAEAVVNLNSTVYEKMPLKRTSTKFTVNPGAQVLSI